MLLHFMRKYKTWTPLVRADADRAEINSALGARYNYLSNPAIVARLVEEAYLRFDMRGN